MSFNLMIILSLCGQLSIHHYEHELHRASAEITPIVNYEQSFVPKRFQERTMIKDYYGYCPYWIDTTYFAYFQLDLLTHCAYFGVDIDPATGALTGIPNQYRFEMIRDTAHAAGIDVHMTFTIFGNSNVTAFLNNAAARQNAITGMSSFVTNYGLDGVNIDFEFVTSSVKDSFNLFMHNLAYEMWNHSGGYKDVYIAAPAVPEWYPGYDVAYLSDNCDGLFIMAYNFHYSGSAIAGPVSPCVPSSFWGSYCCARSIGSYLGDGADSTKLLLGVPYYGIDWPTETGDIGSGTTGSGAARIYYYAFQDANTYGRIWDTYSLTPWYHYYTSEWHQCWYDDSASLDVKLGLVLDSVIQGAGCWALGYDRSYDHLWNTIRRRFWDPSMIQETEKTSCIECAVINTVSKTSWRVEGLYKDQVYSVRLYSLTGRLMEQRLHSGSSIMEIGHGMSPGIYFIVILHGHERYIHKVIMLE